jgi:ribonuclease BN (tRNA processing enzyme)
MTVRIQMIGTGTMFGKKYDNNSAIATCNSFRLLIDCGVTATRSLHRLGIPLDHFHGALITHLHADHIGGLEEFALQMKYVYRKTPTLYLPEALIEPIWEHSLKGGLSDPGQGLDRLDSYFHVVAIPDNTPILLGDGFQIEVIPTRHIPGKPSYSLFINDTLFYSADVQFDRDLIELAYYKRQCKYLLHDCQLFGPETVHATLDNLLTLPDEIQRAVYLMHYNDEMEDFIGKTGSMTFLIQDQIYNFA